MSPIRTNRRRETSPSIDQRPTAGAQPIGDILAVLLSRYDLPVESRNAAAARRPAQRQTMLAFKSA